MDYPFSVSQPIGEDIASDPPGLLELH